MKSLKREWFEVGKGWIYSGVLCLLFSLGCYWLTNHSDPNFWLFNMWIFIVIGCLFIPIGIARLWFFGFFRIEEGNNIISKDEYFDFFDKTGIRLTGDELKKIRMSSDDSEIIFDRASNYYLNEAWLDEKQFIIKLSNAISAKRKGYNKKY